jgi:NAD(P)-dependent dehydrogenase (short-subunit alcohol dehydrogenase family)
MFKEGLLKGKRILITGGGTGLGKEIAGRYLELGAELWLAGRRGGVLEDTAKELTSRHGGVVRSAASGSPARPSASTAPAPSPPARAPISPSSTSCPTPSGETCAP